MTLTARKPYRFEPVDGVERYHGNQLLYVSWDHHLMFAAPFILCVSPTLRFSELVDTVIRPLVAADPDAAQVAWLAAEWIKGGQPFAPDFERSLKDNGVGHKDLLRFRTPGLNTLCRTAPA